MSDFKEQFNAMANVHHQMMVERGFHEPVGEIEQFVGMQVCARIRSQTRWLEDVRNGLSVDEYRESYDFEHKVRQCATTKTTLLKCTLIATELIELVEEVIKPEIDQDACVEELGDIVLRAADLAAAMGWDLGEAIERKIEKNATRAHKHGKRF